MSLALKLPRDQVTSLRPRDVQLYLVSRGWVSDAAESSSSAMLFHHPAMADAEIMLPLRRDLGDYTLRMADVVQALAITEKRSLFEVLNDLSGPPSDVLRLRVLAEDATLGNFPLDEGIQLLRGGRDMLLSAACSVKRPQAFHPEKPLKDASEFIKRCRLGQTERGSFVATIIAPVPPAFEQRPLLPDDEFQEALEPFGRRVTTRLMTSLDIIDHAIKAARLDPIFDGVDEGVSANLCEAVFAMRPPGDQSRLDVNMSWSRSRPRLPEGVPQVVSFHQADFPIIEEAGRRLRERAVPRRERFVGKVHALQSDVPSLFDDLVGKIIIKTTVGGQPARVKVVLNREDYKRACDAHRDEKRVAVTGVIHHDVKIRVYEISEPRDFQVLDEYSASIS
jgi:hypothetical protein